MGEDGDRVVSHAGLEDRASSLLVFKRLSLYRALAATLDDRRKDRGAGLIGLVRNEFSVRMRELANFGIFGVTRGLTYPRNSVEYSFEKKLNFAEKLFDESF